MLAKLQCQLLIELVVIQLGKTWSLPPAWGGTWLLVSFLRNTVLPELCRKYCV